MASQKKHRYTPVWLMFCGGALLSIVTCIAVWNWEREIRKTQFQNQADKLTTALQQSINSNLEVLQASGQLYAASRRVDRQEFKVFVKDFLARHPSIYALNWTSRVSVKERQAFEQGVQSEGYPAFQITERGKQGKMVRAAQRLEYFPITYVEPSQIEGAALGFDLASEFMRRAALEKARNTGAVSATGRIKIVTTNQLGFLAFQPVYRDASTDSLQARRENLQGVTTGVFQIADIVKAALPGVDLDNIDFYLIDNSATVKDQFLSFYQSTTKQVTADPSRQLPVKFDVVRSLCSNQAACTRILTVADRQWLLVVLPGPGYTDIQTYWGAWTSLLCGLLLTTLLTIYLLISLRHTFFVEQLVAERTAQAQQLSQTLETLQKTQAQLIQTEKMSSLGQLVAGVAHEINNPVNFIYGNLSHANAYAQDLLEILQLYQQHYPNPDTEIQYRTEAIDLDFLVEDLPNTLSSMKVGAERIRQIVLSLRNFSRFDEAEMKEVDIHSGIDNTLLILQNRLKHKPEHSGIQVIKEYGDLPSVECYAGQLNQVFMNILTNAIDALDSYNLVCSTAEIQSKPGTIKIRTEVVSADRLVVRIADNGPGMTEAVKKRLFDPFFTTKPVGKGTGLGLSISYQIIVEKHGGVLRCQSNLGQGTEFWIEIPVHQTQKISAKEFESEKHVYSSTSSSFFKSA